MKKESIFDCLAIAIGVFLIFKPRPSRPITIMSSIGGKVIFQAQVLPTDWWEVPAWEKDPNNPLGMTQQVVYCQTKDLHKYSQKSLDMWGWLWYYDSGRKSGSVFPTPTVTNVSTGDK